MGMPGIVYGITADDKTTKGLKSAKNGVDKFEGHLKNLGKTLAATFAADKIIAFGKASVKAFEEDQKSAAMLANTMKNLGMQFANPVMETYIQSLSQSAAVADDQLRPAMQKLLSQTGDYFKSQQMLTQAIEISRGSGVELSTVVSDLASAYVGNTKGLKKYNLGLTQAELKTMSFADVQKKLNDQFKGSNAAYLKTYAGQMEVLKVAAGEAQETIGKGLVESLALIAGDGSVQSLADSMQSLADFTSNAIYGMASLVDQLKNLGAATPSWLKALGGKSFSAVIGALPGGQLLKPLQDLAAYGEKKRNQQLQNPSVQMFMTDQANQRLNNQKTKAVKEQLKATKALTAQQKNQAALKKAGTIFDLTQIGLIAALKGNISEEDRKRLELQLALEQGNVDEAKKLTYELAIAQGLGVKLAQDLASLPAASNPFAAWKGYLDEIELQAKRIASFGGGTPTPSPSTNVPNAPIASPDAVLAAASAGFAAANQQIKLIVEGGDEVTSLMRFKIQEAAQSGSTTNWSQTVGAWDR